MLIKVNRTGAVIHLDSDESNKHATLTAIVYDFAQLAQFIADKWHKPVEIYSCTGEVVANFVPKDEW